MKKINSKRFSDRQKTPIWQYRPLLYLLLIAGGIIFSLPFYWLIITSFKAPDEIVVSSTSWVPEVPPNISYSPYFISEKAISKPDGVNNKDWDKSLALLEEYTWERIVRYKDSVTTREVSGYNGEDTSWEAKMAFIAGDRWGVWKRQMIDAVIKRALPVQDNNLNEQSSIEQITGVVMNRISPEEIKNALDKSYCSFALGRLVVRNVDQLDFNLKNFNLENTDRWKLESSNLSPVSMVVIDRDSALEIPYKFSAEKSVDTIVYSASLPFSASMLDRINLAIHSDGSYNNLNLVVYTKSGVYKSSDDYSLDTRSWKEAIWRFGPREAMEVTPSIPLVKVGGARASLADTNQIKLVLLVSKTPHFNAIIQKFMANYKELIEYLPFLTYLRNTIILLVLNIFAQIFASSFVAYGFSRIHWPGRNIVFVLVLSTMMLPGQVTMIPQFLIWRNLGMYNTWQPLWMMSLFGSAFNIFLLRQFFMTLPKELEDAARVDGCGYFRTYWKIMLPQLKPALATIAIFQFMGTWNNFMGPLIYISSDNLSPLALGIYTLQTVHRSDWGMLMSASLLMALPTILIFLFAQRYFIKGVTFTGTKG